MNKKNKAAIYLRISREDGDTGESGSISNQRQLLMSFLSEREDLEYVSEYVDDGVSGYLFSRPGFDRMMQDAKVKKLLWSSETERRILENPIYIGTLIQGKTTAVSYRDRRRMKRAESELLSFENAHDAIISDTAFLIVQDLLSRDSYSSSKKGSYLFTGFIFCGCCGKPLYHRQDKDRHSWQCKNSKCPCGTIQEDVLSDSVYTTLSKHVAVVMDHAEPVDNEELIQNLHLKDLKIQELTQQLNRLKASETALDKQKEAGVISQADHTEMSEYYKQKSLTICSEIKEIEQKKIRLSECVEEIMGVLLYTDFGFVKNGNFMQYKL